MSRQISISELVRNFADACRALVANLDRACVPWSDGRQYDNWDRIAEALFESLVLEPCCFQVKASFPNLPMALARYGYPPRGENVFLALVTTSDATCRFIQLLSIDGPFDSCEGTIDGNTSVRPMERAELRLVVTDADGAYHEIRTVDLNL